MNFKKIVFGAISLLVLANQPVCQAITVQDMQKTAKERVELAKQKCNDGIEFVKQKYKDTVDWIKDNPKKTAAVTAIIAGLILYIVKNKYDYANLIIQGRDNVQQNTILKNKVEELTKPVETILGYHDGINSDINSGEKNVGNLTRYLFYLLDLTKLPEDHLQTAKSSIKDLWNFCEQLKKRGINIGTFEGKLDDPKYKTLILASLTRTMTTPSDYEEFNPENFSIN